MSNQSSFLKVLWGNIIGETKKQIESMSWEGAVQLLIDETGQIIITSLLPAGAIIAPIYSFFVSPVSRALKKTYRDGGKMNVHISKSGLAIFERPPLITSTIPKTIELPITELIKPNNTSILNPIGRMQYPSRQIIRTHRLPSRPLLRRSRIPQSTVKNDILYPKWAFTGEVPNRGRSTKLYSLSDIENKKWGRRSIERSLTQKQNAQFSQAKRLRDMNQKLSNDAIKRSRDQADRVRKQQQQREQAERARRLRNRLNRK